MSSPLPRRYPRRGGGEENSGEKKRDRPEEEEKKDLEEPGDEKKFKSDEEIHETNMGLPELTGIAMELSSLKNTLQNLISGIRIPAAAAAATAASHPPTLFPHIPSTTFPALLPTAPAATQGGAWGVLRNQRDGLEISLLERVITIGRSVRCHVVVEDAMIPGILARVRHGSDGVQIECLAGAMCVNDSPLRLMVRTPLKSGDHITFMGAATHVYSFSLNNNAQLDSLSPSGGSGSTAAAPPPIMSESSKFRLRVLEDLQKRLVSTQGAAGAAAALVVAVPSASLEDAEPTSLKRLKSSPGSEDADSNVPAAAVSTPSVPRAGSISPGAAAAAATRAAEEKAERMALLEAEFRGKILKPEDNVFAFETFPYHLAEPTREILLNSLAVFLNQPELIPFTTNLQITPGILLEGPYGTELYQSALINAVARKHDASVLLIDAPHPILVPDPTHRAAMVEADPNLRESVFSGLLRPKLSSLSSGGGGSLTGLKKASFKKGDRVRFLGVEEELDRPEADLRGPSPGMAGEIVLTFDEDNRSTVGVAFDEPVPGGVSFGGACDEGMGYFVNVTALRPETEDYAVHELEGLCVDAIMKVAAENAPIIVCFRDIEGVVFSSYTRYKKFQRAFRKLPPRVVVVGLRTSPSDKAKNSDRGSGSRGGASALMDLGFLEHIRIGRGGGEEPAQNERATKMMSKLLPTRVTITAPTRNPELAEWKRAMEEDIKQIKLRSNCAQLSRLLEKSNISLDVDALDTAYLQAEIYTPQMLEQAVGWAVGHLARTVAGGVKQDGAGKLILPLASMEHAFGILKMCEDQTQTSSVALRNVVTENEFEKKILSDVVPAEDLNVTFEEIGALENVKQTLRELVMLPLTRPELFRRGHLTKPTKGVLLFGPPGTGKTMLAKAVATECKANFINVSMASIGSKWFGEGEKFAQAIFTLASKISPAVIFIDEVDSILGKRDRTGEHEAMRKIKNTVMSMWDGLRSSENERVIVLAASNRPFDLDDAVLRRLSRRMLVDLPDAAQREQILSVMLAKEDLAPGFDFGELARSTDGYSGSDLKNLCVAAAYIPIREVLEAERASGKDPHLSSGPNAPPVALRPLQLSDFLRAREEVSSSVSEDAQSIAELREWNRMYGEGGDRQKKNLSYYL